MYKMEVEKIDLIIEKLEKLAYSLNGKKYDFTKYFVGNNLIDEFIFKLDNFEVEKNKQDKMKEIVKEVISDDIKKYFEKLMSKNNQCFDGWISISYESLRQKSGVSHIRRVVKEFEVNGDIVEIDKCSGVLSRYKLNDDLLEVVDNEF